MFLGESKYKIDDKGEVKKYIIVYPLAEWKKLAVCNSLVGMRSNRFSSERRQLENKGGRNRSERF